MLIKADMYAASSGGGKLVVYASETSDGGYNFNLTKDGEVILPPFSWNSEQHYEDENIIFNTDLYDGQCRRMFTNKKDGIFRCVNNIYAEINKQESHSNTPSQYTDTVYQYIAE